jgi:transcription termination factor Rho
MLDSNKLNDKLVSELREIAQTLGVQDTDTLRKQDLISKILEFAETSPAAENIEAVTDRVDTAESSDSGARPRKRLRSTKPVAESKQHKEVPLDNTRTFDFPEDDDIPAIDPVQNVSNSESPSEALQESKDVKPSRTAGVKKI